MWGSFRERALCYFSPHAHCTLDESTHNIERTLDSVEWQPAALESSAHWERGARIGE